MSCLHIRSPTSTCTVVSPVRITRIILPILMSSALIYESLPINVLAEPNF